MLCPGACNLPDLGPARSRLHQLLFFLPAWDRPSISLSSLPVAEDQVNTAGITNTAPDLLATYSLVEVRHADDQQVCAQPGGWARLPEAPPLCPPSPKRECTPLAGAGR